MDYTQRNPLPMPPSGAFESVRATIDTVFDWQYELRKKNLLALYEKGKTLTWNANDLDWSIDVDAERLMGERIANGAADLMNTLMSPPIPLAPDELMRMQLNMNAFMLSQFLHGEQGALVATAKIVQGVPWEEAKFYAANQVADEARHVEVYHRYLTEKLGISYEINPELRQLLDEIVCDARWDITFLGMQIMVEGLALAAFGVTRMQMADEPLIQDLITRVMADESRHVAFGVISLADLYTNEMSASELREREDFVIEATHLLRDRLLMEAVFERLGWDVKLWVDWAKQTPFMTGFRQMMFSKIVPNLKRLGLLTARVRAEYAKLDLLKFETMKDSVEEPEMTPPHELVELLMRFMADSSAAGMPAGGAGTAAPAA
ncbi:MAG TPA: ferritin-like domain-containing protein [Candidatus Binatia bacterium]|nr:ferritin-like domain-containing protein [Candidatus Binatia bacterium]